MTKKQNRDLRVKALQLIDRGMSSQQVGEKLAIKKMTVAGWLSARTKGQYDGERA